MSSKKNSLYQMKFIFTTCNFFDTKNFQYPFKKTTNTSTLKVLLNLANHNKKIDFI